MMQVADSVYGLTIRVMKSGVYLYIKEETKHEIYMK